MINETCPWCKAKSKCDVPNGNIIFACASFENPITYCRIQSKACKSKCRDKLLETLEESETDD